MSKKFFISLLFMMLSLPVILSAKVSAYIQPGISLFSDTVGYDIKAGSQFIYFTDRLSLGANVTISGAETAGTSIFNISLGADLAYDIPLFIGDKLPLKVTPVFSVGWAYDDLKNTSYGTSRKMGVLLAPRAELSYVISENHRAGIVAGYSLYIYDVSIQYINIGISYSYFFGVHALNKDSIIGDNNEKID